MEKYFNLDKAKEILDSGLNQAQELLKDTSKIDSLLQELEGKLADIPTVGTSLARVPLMIRMVKSYITKEYTNVSPKVIAALVSSFLYLVKKKDLIPDNIPLIGHLDDIGVIAVALKLCEKELGEYAEWKDGKREAAEAVLPGETEA